MSTQAFEILHAASRELTDDFIDEDLSEFEVGPGGFVPGIGAGRRTVMSRVVTVRGRRSDHPIIITYHDHYTDSLSTRAIYQPHVLEVFVAQPALTFEGRCRRRDRIDRLLRWFGGGGLKGAHPVFERCRVDSERGASLADFDRGDFADGLIELVEGPGCMRVVLQASTGLSALHRWHATGRSPSSVLDLLDATIAVAARLNTTARSQSGH